MRERFKYAHLFDKLEKMRRLILMLVVGILFLSITTAQNNSGTQEIKITTSESSSGQQLEQTESITKQKQITEEQKKEILGEFDKEKAGTTPDSMFYFVDDLMERATIGNSPEKALDYREEKIAEARIMIDEGKKEEAEKVLDKAMKYGDVLEKEVSPEMKARVRESSENVQEVLNELKDETKGEEWKDVQEKFLEVEKKEKKIGTASELVSKINELCETLAKLDPLQYADNCKPKDNSPKWMKDKDKELTKEQEEKAKILFDKLSKCFENPKECDCKGTGIQKFEEVCEEKSKMAVKCMDGDKTACENMGEDDPTEFLPDYLVPVFEKVERKYSRAGFDNFMPEECKEANAKTPDECNKIMFKLHAPEECIDAGIIGESRDDERKCKELMFKANTPKECTDAGITAKDKDAPRKCAKIMFQQNAPEECINAGITGEGKGDERKCRELMEGRGEKEKQGRERGPVFGKDCSKIQDTGEKVKCFEEFYNNAQFQIKDDFRQREFKPRPGEQKCPDNICDEFEKNNPDACPEDCGGERRARGEQGNICQTPTQVDNLKKDCRDRGQEAIVENKGGCPWVVCMGKTEPARREEIRQERPEYKEGDYYGNYNKDYRKEEIPVSQPTGSEQLRYPQPPVQPSQPIYQPPPTTQPTLSPEQPRQEPSPELTPQPSPTPVSSPMTGGVISIDNPFFDYWWGRG